MGKLLTRSFIVILLALTVYLYIEVVNLQRVNTHLTASLAQMTQVRVENARLRTQLADLQSSRYATPSGSWLNMARADLRSAGQAVEQGNFTEALSKSQQASDTIGAAAHQASDRSRAAALTLHNRLASLQTRARDFWHSFGG